MRYPPLSRRRFLALGAGAAVLTAGCSAEKPGTVASDGSVTVTHVFGDTTIPRPPTRVVSAGYTGQDDLLAFGVVPVAVTDWFGAAPFGVWPWAQPRLGGARPVVLNLVDGIQVEAIGALKPDLIVATNAGLDADTYTELSAIAPTVAQAGRDAFFEPWKDQATTIGQAVFKSPEVGGLITAVDDAFTRAGESNTSFQGRKALLVRGAFEGGAAVVTPGGWRTEFLTQLGFTVPGGLDEFTDGDRALVPRDRIAAVLDTADVLIWTTESDEEQAALLADPVFAELTATRRNRNVLTDRELAGAIAFSSLLSLPLVAERLPTMLAKVLA